MTKWRYHELSTDHFCCFFFSHDFGPFSCYHRFQNVKAYVELFASPIAGVGVRAFRPIPAGVDPFPICNMHMAAKARSGINHHSQLVTVKAFGLTHGA